MWSRGAELAIEISPKIQMYQYTGKVYYKKIINNNNNNAIYINDLLKNSKIQPEFIEIFQIFL